MFIIDDFLNENAFFFKSSNYPYEDPVGRRSLSRGEMNSGKRYGRNHATSSQNCLQIPVDSHVYLDGDLANRYSYTNLSRFKRHSSLPGPNFNNFQRMASPFNNYSNRSSSFRIPVNWSKMVISALIQKLFFAFSEPPSYSRTGWKT